ncbi:methionyl-tRNA formyltransferase [Candidatus Uhrbacteria bacterium]|nr:methionyl-tRNA formyltransferase [Candidatus Uhrbacteria bacterium]
MTKIVFFGTSSFAVPALRALASDPRFSIVEVITQPDRPVGRHAEMTETPVKQAAKELGLPVFTELSEAAFDAAVVASYGVIIKQHILDLAPHRFLNIHASLLPKYRGASPIREAIKNGDAETGVTIMEMDAGMDHGPILSIHKEPILKDDDTPTLTERLAALGAAVIGDVLAGVLDGSIQPVPQDESEATYVKLLKREDGKIDLDSMSPEQIERLIRANRPWPGTYIEKNGKRLKILDAHLEDGKLVFDMVQPEGKTAQTWAAFLRGNRDWN